MHPHPWVELLEQFRTEQLNFSSHSPLSLKVLSQRLLSSFGSQEEVAAVDKLHVRGVVSVHLEMSADVPDEVVREVGQQDVLFQRELLTY